MIRFKLLTCFTIIVLALNLTSASLSFTMHVDENFEIGKMIKFSYTITSTDDSEITYTPYVKCQNTPQPFLEIRQASLIRNQPYSSEYEFIEITEDITTQDCSAYIMILSPNEEKYEEKFTLKTGLLSMSYRTFFCKDSSCETESKIFLQNENIYFSYVCDALNPSITATLTYPDGSKSQISIPGSIRAEQIGTYELAVTASKEGYKTVSLSQQFGVIEKNAEIGTISPLAKQEENAPVSTSPVQQISQEQPIASENQEQVIETPVPQEKKNNLKEHIVFIITLSIVFTIAIVLILLLISINKKKKH